MKGKKITAALCTLLVITASAGGIPKNDRGLFDTAITASAATNPVYTITIPESVNIDGGTAEFKAESVTLPAGAKINITVDGENTESGQTTFNALNEAKDSTVQYTIKTALLMLLTAVLR